MNRLRLYLLALTALLVCTVKADEGMWLLQLMQQQHSIDMMKKQGLKLEAQDLYNPNGVSLKDADGFGEEVQRYRNGEYYDSFRFQWWWEDSYSRNLVLDYGRYGGISYMDDVRVSGNQLWGTFFFSDDSPGFNFTLYME